jgi:hypothetical protein
VGGWRQQAAPQQAFLVVGYSDLGTNSMLLERKKTATLKKRALSLQHAFVSLSGLHCQRKLWLVRGAWLFTHHSRMN